MRIDVGNDGDFDDGGREDYGPLSPLVSPAGKSFNFEHNLSTLGDDDYRVQFRVRDGGWDAAPLAEKAFHEQESAVVSFAINGAAPVVNLTKILVDARYTGDDDLEITSGFGGSYLNNDSTFTFSVTDASGLSSVEFSINGTDWDPADDAGGGNYTRLLTINTVTHAFDGTRNLHYRATDGYGKQTSAMVTVIVDTYEPEISFTSPGGMTLPDAPNVNGDVNVQGTVTDSSAVTGVTIVAGLADQIDLTNTGNNYSWKVLLEDSGQYDDPAYADDQPGNVWRLPVKVTAYEFARNRTTLTGWLDIDPDSDRPQVTVVSPADDDSVAGVFLVSGTVSDDDGAKSVRLQIDLNNDGVYGPNGALFDGDLDLDGLNGTNDDYETESVSKTITVTNGAWSLLLNGSGELNKANLVARGLATAGGTIGLRVIPLDIHDVEGPEQTLQVYIDSESPLITGLLVDGLTETPNPTPATGSLQKGTLDLRALFKDDKALLDSSMQVSLNGGASFQPIEDIAGYQIIDAGTTNPYQYRIKIPVNTATAVAGGNGNLDIVLKITDQTYKQTTRTVQYRVDNTLPEVAWNLTGTPPNLVAKLPFQDSIPDEIYSFLGDGSTNSNLLFGKASDSGEISGIARIDVYFVKDGSDFINPRTGDPAARRPTRPCAAATWTATGTATTPIKRGGFRAATSRSRLHGGRAAGHAHRHPHRDGAVRRRPGPGRRRRLQRVAEVQERLRGVVRLLRQHRPAGRAGRRLLRGLR